MNSLALRRTSHWFYFLYCQLDPTNLKKYLFEKNENLFGLQLDNHKNMVLKVYLNSYKCTPGDMYKGIHSTIV